MNGGISDAKQCDFVGVTHPVAPTIQKPPTDRGEGSI
jgi:hypothetical protein